MISESNRGQQIGISLPPICPFMICPFLRHVKLGEMHASHYDG